MFPKLFQQFREAASRDFTLVGLKTLNIVWALVVIIAALFIDNKWFLAGMLAYEVLP